MEAIFIQKYPFLRRTLLENPIYLNKKQPNVITWTTALSNSMKLWVMLYQFSSVAQSYPTLRSHESQKARPPCPSPTTGVHPNSCALSWWCHPAISSSVVPFSSCPQSLPASESFPMSQLFTWGGQSIGGSASASVLPVNT